MTFSDLSDGVLDEWPVGSARPIEARISYTSPSAKFGRVLIVGILPLS